MKENKRNIHGVLVRNITKKLLIVQQLFFNQLTYRKITVLKDKYLPNFTLEFVFIQI